MRQRRIYWLSAGAGLLVATLAVAAANWLVVSRNAERVVTDLDRLPRCDVALVLGANPKLASGRANPHFENRMDAAAQLYATGRVKHLLVSGDNHSRDYDEPTSMRQALIARGVPDTAITSDFAGRRTLDSVVRAREIFGLQRCIIVSQRYHNARALEIARARGLDAWAWCARDVRLAESLRTELREVLARTVTMLDLYVWHRQPRFLGKAEPIQIANR